MTTAASIYFNAIQLRKLSLYNFHSQCLPWHQSGCRIDRLEGGRFLSSLCQKLLTGANTIDRPLGQFKFDSAASTVFQYQRARLQNGPIKRGPTQPLANQDLFYNRPVKLTNQEAGYKFYRTLSYRANVNVIRPLGMWRRCKELLNQKVGRRLALY